MSKIIEGIPEFLTHEQYMALFEAVGVDPGSVQELRAAHDGVHAIVFERNERGELLLDRDRDGYYKHRVFIPVRRTADDERTTRTRPVTKG